jgi:hypothetical protein
MTAHPEPQAFAPNPGGTVVLRYSLATRIAFTLLAIPPLVVGVVGLLGRFPGSESPTTKAIYSALFLLLAVYVLLEINFVSITLDQVRLVHRSPWRRNRSIPWTEVHGLSRPIFSSWLVIHTQQGRVRVSDSIRGAEELAALVTERTQGGEPH